MLDAPPTRASLLVRIRYGRDQEAWRQFVQVYAPVVYGFARKRGLQDADAADVMQDVLRSVAGAAGRLKYDPARGSFRGWLYTVARNKIFNFLEAARHKLGRGTGFRRLPGDPRHDPRAPLLGGGSPRRSRCCRAGGRSCLSAPSTCRNAGAAPTNKSKGGARMLRRWGRRAPQRLQ